MSSIHLDPDSFMVGKLPPNTVLVVKRQPKNEGPEGKEQIIEAEEKSGQRPERESVESEPHKLDADYTDIEFLRKDLMSRKLLLIEKVRTAGAESGEFQAFEFQSADGKVYKLAPSDDDTEKYLYQMFSPHVDLSA